MACDLHCGGRDILAGYFVDSRTAGVAEVVAVAASVGACSSEDSPRVAAHMGSEHWPCAQEAAVTTDYDVAGASDSDLVLPRVYGLEEGRPEMTTSMLLTERMISPKGAEPHYSQLLLSMESELCMHG